MNRTTKKTTAFLFTVISLILFSYTYTASAAIDPISGQECIAWGLICAGGPTPQAIIINYIWTGINVVLGFLATIAAAALIYYGVLYILSRGDENKINQAKTGIMYALIGIIVVGLAAWLVNATINLF